MMEIRLRRSQPLLALGMHDNVDGRPYVRAMFAFVRDGAEQSSPGERAILDSPVPQDARMGEVDGGLFSAERESEIFSTIA